MSKTSIDVEVCSNCGPLQRLGSWLCNCRGGNHEAVPFVPASELAAAQEEGRAWKDRAEQLWQLLDDIDTFGDLAKDNERMYRNLAEAHHRKRFALARSPDGQVLNWVTPVPPKPKDMLADEEEERQALVKSQAAIAQARAENCDLAAGLGLAQEEGRELRAALEFALDEWAAETTDCDTCGKPKLESFYIDEARARARAEAKPTGGEG